MATIVDDSVDAGVTKYLNIISTYDNEFKPWEARVKKVIKAYRKDKMNGSIADSGGDFNILWSNVQTLKPAVYAKLPKADVSRRFGDNDQVGRVASLLIERSLDFEVEHYPDFRQTMSYSVEDRFLGGRAVAWARYEPHVRAQEQGLPEDGTQVTDDTDEPENEIAPQAETVAQDTQTSGADDTEPAEEIDYECAPVDYVHWKDFGHNVARMWDEVTVVWRIVYMTRAALVERFGEEKAKQIPIDSGPTPLDRQSHSLNENTRAKIYEVWDKETGKVYWISKTFGEFVDVRDDPLELEQFFPCPRPLYATLTSDTLIPVPDYCLYQSQANELNILSDRIDGLVKALKVRGVYDASVPALRRLFTEGSNNDLIPVENWMPFSEKGGLKGAIDLVPLDMISKALVDCYQARDDIKGQVYEITGISDIVRGQTAASETATAQQIKGQYAGLRLRSMQEDVALFATDLLRLKAQIICSKFQPETIVQYAAAQQLTPEDQALVPQALQLIQDRVLRNFRIEVAADSLVQIDEDQNKKDRMEFIAAFGGLLKEALPAAQAEPKLMPIIAEVMKFGVGAFKQARQIEGTLEAAIEKMNQAQKQAEQNPQPPPPDPEQVKMQGQQQIEQMKVQATQATEQGKLQVEQVKAQVEQQRSMAEMQIRNKEIDTNAQIEREKIAANIEIERNKISAANDLELAKLAKTLEHEAGMAIEQRTFDAAQADQGRQHEAMQASEQRNVDTQMQDKQMAAAKETEAAKLKAEPKGKPGSDAPPIDMAAIKELVAKIEQANRPRKVIRDEQGLVQALE